MLKHHKVKILLIAAVFMGYIGFYHYVTHNFKADIQVNPFMSPCIAKRFGTQEARSAYAMQRIQDSNPCKVRNDPCHDEVGFFINPYARQRALVACESRIRTLILTRFINDPDYDCKLKPPEPMKKN